MELLHLKYFQTIARLESVTQAAEELHISQPALSKILARLEHELGRSLFDRRNRQLHLNAAGQVFLRHVQRVFRELQEAEQALGGLSEMDDSSVVAASSSSRLLPHLHHGGRLADGGIGMIGGILGGLGGFTGTPVTLWYTLRGWDKDSGRAVLQTFNIAMHALTLTVYALNGLVTADLGWLCLWAVPAMVLPALIGIRLYDRIDDAAFRRLILMLLLASGVVLLATSLPRLLGFG